MSDETSRTERETPGEASSAAPEGAGAGPAGPQGTTATPVGFCQDCGRGLTPETLRAVGKAVFCEPCLELRLHHGQPAYGAGAPGTAGSSPAQGYGGPEARAYGPSPAPVPGEPSPVLAGLLGLIPGVGAMYNGQFAKGVIHLIIFAILVSLADNVNGIFGLLVAGWVVYQAFEAYHTAVARRDLLPLPNAFGFNDIGERMGFGSNWGAGGSAKGPGTPRPAAARWPAGADTPPPWRPAGTAPPTSGPQWAGYVPPAAFAQAGTWRQPAAPGAHDEAATGMGNQPPAYTDTFAGTPAAGYTANPYGSAAPVVPVRRFPAGAIWLIALGVLILLANLAPDWRISQRWMPPLLFAGLAVWLFTRRLHAGVRFACIIRWPVIFMVLAILFALHALQFEVAFGTMVAVLLITFGALLLVERMSSLGQAPVAGNPVYVPAADPARTTFTGAEPVSRQSTAADDVAEGRP